MKKLVFLFLVIFIYGCGGSYQKAEMAAPDSLAFSLDTVEYVLQSEEIPFPSETLNVIRDTFKKEQKRITDLRIDTTSNLDRIIKNKELIDYQQKQLDSLLIKKR